MQLAIINILNIYKSIKIKGHGNHYGTITSNVSKNETGS